MIDIPFNKYRLSMSNSKQRIFFGTAKLPPVFTHKLCLAYIVLFGPIFTGIQSRYLFIFTADLTRKSSIFGVDLTLYEIVVKISSAV